MGTAPGPGVSRRRLLAGLVLVGPALGGCALVAATGQQATDPLIALADAARADAALAAAAVSADRALAERVQPLVDARTEHAAALEAEIQRLRPSWTRSSPTPAPPRDHPVTLARVREAARASADAAAGAALELPVDRVGLVASVAACCAGYAAVLS